MHALMPILALVAAYLIGGIPFGYLVVKWKTGADVRAAGSGNIGATNVLRTTGRAAGRERGLHHLSPPRQYRAHSRGYGARVIPRQPQDTARSDALENAAFVKNTS